MVTTEDYVARTEGTCGKEQDVIVIFKYDKKDEAVKKILGKVYSQEIHCGDSFRIDFREILFSIVWKWQSHLQRLEGQGRVKCSFVRASVVVSLRYSLS